MVITPSHIVVEFIALCSEVWCICITLKYACHSLSVQLILICNILLVLIYTFTWSQVCNYNYVLKTTWLHTFERHYEFGPKQKQRAKWERTDGTKLMRKLVNVIQGKFGKKNVAWVSGKWEHGKRFSRIHVSKLRYDRIFDLPSFAYLND